MHALYLNVRQHGLFLSAFESAYPKVHHTILSFADLYMNKGHELGQGRNARPRLHPGLKF
jgi:hypothetical protein